MSFKKLKKSLKYRASSLSNATVLNVPDLNKTKSKLRDIRSPTVEARCTSVQSFNQAGDLRRRIVTHSKERAYNYVQCIEVASVKKRKGLARAGSWFMSIKSTFPPMIL